MSDLRARLSEAAGVAFAALGLAAEYGRVGASDRPDLADFQCNGALAAAKSLRRNPREIAQAVADALRSDPSIAEVSVAGPGFINLRVAAETLSQRADALAADERAGAARVTSPRRVLVDYGGPNVAK